jgi:hypothetical protein
MMNYFSSNISCLLKVKNLPKKYYRICFDYLF